MTGGWAATNTLREAVTGFGFQATNPYLATEAEAALALVEAALDAAEHLRQLAEAWRAYDAKEGPSASNSKRRAEIVEEYLAAALRAVREGK